MYGGGEFMVNLYVLIIMAFVDILLINRRITKLEEAVSQLQRMIELYVRSGASNSNLDKKT